LNEFKEKEKILFILSLHYKLWIILFGITALIGKQPGEARELMKVQIFK